MFQLSVFPHQQELTRAADQIAVILGGLEVGHTALAGPKLEGGGDILVSVFDPLSDCVVQDGRECRRGIEELTAGQSPQIILAHAQQACCAALAVSGHTLNGQVPQAHPPELFCALCRALHRHPGPHQHGVHCAGTKIVLSGIPGPRLHRGAMPDHVLHGGSPNGIHRRPAADIVLRVHAHLAAKLHNIAVALALLCHGPLGFLGAGRRRRSLGDTFRLLSADTALTTGSALIFRLLLGFVDFPLEGVKLRLFLFRQAPPGSAGGVQNCLLPLDPLLFLHVLDTSILF